MTDEDPSPWLVYLGDEVKRLRTNAGLSQVQLAKKIFCARSLVSMAETAAHLPTEKFVDDCDAVFGTDGHLGRLRARVKAEVQPTKPNRIARLIEDERRAASIRLYQPVFVPGLLQVEPYVRALFAGGLLAGESQEEIDENVARRLRRQGVLERPKPPRCWFVLDESILHRVIGDEAIMRLQLDHLLTMGRRRAINIQVLPSFTGGVIPTSSPMILLDMGNEDDVVHLDGPAGSNVTTTDPVMFSECAERFDLLRAQSLPLAASLRMLEARLKEL